MAKDRNAEPCYIRGPQPAGRGGAALLSLPDHHLGVPAIGRRLRQGYPAVAAT